MGDKETEEDYGGFRERRDTWGNRGEIKMWFIVSGKLIVGFRLHRPLSGVPVARQLAIA